MPNCKMAYIYILSQTINYVKDESVFAGSRNLNASLLRR